MTARILLSLAALLVPGTAQRDPDLPVPGMWETRMTFVSFEEAGGKTALTDNVKASFREPIVDRECDDQTVPYVGEARGACTVVRVGTKGPNVDYEMKCDAMGDKHSGRAIVTGTRAPDRYDYRVSTDIYDEKGALQHTLVVREAGVRVGECPAKK
jgi:hypothetical protein